MCRFFLLGFAMLACLAMDADCWHNQVSRAVSDIIDKIVNGSVSAIDLGDGIGRISDLDIKLVDFSKFVDGRRTFGFKLETSFEKGFIVGKYDIANIELPDLFPIFGKGNCEANLTNFHAKIDVDIKRNFGQSKFDVNILTLNLSVEESSVHLENFMFDSGLSEFLSQLIGNLIPDFLKIISTEGITVLESVVEFVANEIFRCIQQELLTGKLEECIANITLKPAATFFYRELKGHPFEKISDRLAYTHLKSVI